MARNAAEAGSSLKRRSPGLQARASGNEFNYQEENVMANTNTVTDMRKFVEARNGKAFTTSQQVANAFGKQHHHVMQKLDSLECSDGFLTSNFSRVNFNHRGNTYEACEMTKDGFMFLVMGFTGKKAAEIKEGYIAAFNWMAESLGVDAADLVGSVIGTSGVNVLDRVIDQKASPVPAGLQRSFKHTMKSRLRSRFNVQRTDLIPADALADACNFVAAYALEGEWLGKEQPVQPVITLDEISTANLRALCHHAEWLLRNWNATLSPALRQVRSPLAADFHDHFVSVGLLARNLVAPAKLALRQAG